MDRLKEQMQRLADTRREIPDSATCGTAEQHAEREKKREYLHQDALAVWAHYQETGLHLSAAEADSWLAKLEADKDAKQPECHD